MNKSLILLPVLSLLALTGCNAGGGDGDNSGDTTNQSSGDALPYNQEEAKNKLRELGEEQGIEIAYHAFDDEDDEIPESNTFGMKEEYSWYFSGDDKTVLKLDEAENLYVYNNSGADGAYELTYTYPNGADTYDQLITTYTMMFFFANSYSDGYTKVRDLTYAGRAASEYHYAESYAGVVAVSVTAIIDKGTGITLYWDATGDNYVEGEHGSATFEVTSFKVGSQVALPPIEE